MRKLIGKVFNNKTKIVVKTEIEKANFAHELLVEGKSVYQLSKKYKNTSEILQELKLGSEHCGNFKNIRKGAIFSTLRYYKRYDIIHLLEIHFYGVSNNQSA